MTFKLRSRLRGAHVRATLFVGVDAEHLQNSGELVMSLEQWCELHLLLCEGQRWLGLYSRFIELLFDMDDSALVRSLNEHWERYRLAGGKHARKEEDERCPSPSPAQNADASAPKKSTPS